MAVRQRQAPPLRVLTQAHRNRVVQFGGSGRPAPLACRNSRLLRKKSTADERFVIQSHVLAGLEF